MTRCATAMGAGVAASHLLPQSAGFAITSDLASVVDSPSRMASSSTSNVPARGRPMGSPLLRSDPFALSEVRPQHGGAEPSGAGVAALHLLPQSAGYASNVSEVRP